MISVKKLFISLVLVFFTLLIALSSFVFLNQDQFKQEIIRQINQSKAIDGTISDIDQITFLKSFPSVSLRFKDVEIKELWDHEKTTLLQVSSIKLKLSLAQVLQKKVQINSMVFQDGKLNVRKHKKGFNFQSTGSKKAPILLHLQNITLQNIQVQYHDLQTGQEVQVAIDKANFQGDFLADQKQIEFDAQGDLHQKIVYLKAIEHPIKTRGQIMYNAEDQKTKITLDDLDFKGFSGNLSAEFSGENRTVQVGVGAVDLGDLREMLVDSVGRLIDEVGLEGQLRLTLRADRDSFWVNFGVKDVGFNVEEHAVKVRRGKGNFVLKGLAFKTEGYCFYAKEKLEAEVNGENVELGFKGCNFKRLSFQTTLDQELNVEFLNQFIKQEDSLVFKGGTLQLDTVQLNVQLNEKWQVEQYDYDGALLIKNADLIYKNIQLNELSAKLLSKGPFLYFNEMYVKAFGGEIFSDAKFDLNQNSLQLKGKAEGINISKLFDDFNNFNQSMITSTQIEGLTDLEFTAQLPFTEKGVMDYHKMSLESTVKIKEGKLLNVNTFDEMCDFLEQKRLMRKILDINALRAHTKNISFQTLTNKIYISKGVVHIPKMDIHNSVLSLELQGKHDFAQNIDYNFEFFLSEIMQKKSVDRYEDIEIERDAKKRMKMSISLTGTTDKPIFKLNKKQQQQIVREKIQEEQNIIKDLIKAEFDKSHIPKYSAELAPDIEFDHPILRKEKPSNNALEPSREIKPKSVLEEEMIEVDIDNL